MSSVPGWELEAAYRTGFTGAENRSKARSQASYARSVAPAAAEPCYRRGVARLKRNVRCGPVSKALPCYSAGRLADQGSHMVEQPGQAP